MCGISDEEENGGNRNSVVQKDIEMLTKRTHRIKQVSWRHNQEEWLGELMPHMTYIMKAGGTE